MRKRKKLVAAISGGVDSSVAAVLALESGAEVIGITLKLRSCGPETGNGRACCASDDYSYARDVAATLGIPHYVLDVEREFRESVLSYAWNEYKNGRTPNPCARCNRRLKFGLLMDHAKKLGADGLVTGHHARTVSGNNGKSVLCRGKDPEKDQSYFLFEINRNDLAFIHFPVGTMTKAEVRAKAAKQGLSTAEKPESQDACFADAEKTFAGTLSRIFGDESIGGNFVDKQGRILARHNGIHNYTIGQRRGLNIALGVPAYVAAIDACSGDITVVTDIRDLLSKKMRVRDINRLHDGFSEKGFRCEAQIRYGSKPADATVGPMEDKNAEVVFEKAQRAVTPGQAAVFYDKDVVLGGGWIDDAF